MKKKKIWSTITRLTFAFMFVASWAVLGVALALKTAKVEISGGITFTATDVYATISGSVTGSKSSNPIDEHPIEIDSKTSADFTIDESWTKMNLDYQNATTPIVVTIKIENKSTDRPFWIVFADNIEEYHEGYKRQDLSSLFKTDEENAIYSGHNTSVLRKIDKTTLDSRYVTPIKLDGGKSTTIETTISLYNGNYSADDNFKLGIELIGENAIKDEGEYTKLTFNTNEDKTASVKAKNIDIEGEVVIPALFSKNGEIYTVTEIEGYNGSGEPDPSENYGFANCTGSDDGIFISIPSTITKIGHLAFYNSHRSLSFECEIGWIITTTSSDFDSVIDGNGEPYYDEYIR